MHTVIGIDPDVEKSGYAIVLDGEVDSVHTMKAAELLEELKETINNTHPYDKLVIVIEAGWLNSSNWHIGAYCNAHRAAKIGESVGRCHEVGKIIHEWCEHHAKYHDNVKVLAVKPLRKRWRGKDNKITAEELQHITGYTQRTNQEGRDACLLAWVYQNH